MLCVTKQWILAYTLLFSLFLLLKYVSGCVVLMESLKDLPLLVVIDSWCQLHLTFSSLHNFSLISFYKTIFFVCYNLYCKLISSLMLNVECSIKSNTVRPFGMFILALNKLFSQTTISKENPVKSQK